MLSSRKRGPQFAPKKIPISIRLSPDVLEGLRATGQGWQTRADEALRMSLVTGKKVAVRKVVPLCDLSTLGASQGGPMLGDDVELTASPIEDDATEAMALAKLMKWIGFSDVRQHAVNDDEARAMLNTCDKIRRKLADDGRNPR